MRWLVLALVFAGFVELAMDAAVAMKVASAESAQMNDVGAALGGLGGTSDDGGPRLYRIAAPPHHRHLKVPKVHWGPIATFYGYAAARIRAAIHPSS